jgi:hypothetical protein
MYTTRFDLGWIRQRSGTWDSRILVCILHVILSSFYLKKIRIFSVLSIFLVAYTLYNENDFSRPPISASHRAQGLRQSKAVVIATCREIQFQQASDDILFEFPRLTAKSACHSNVPTWQVSSTAVFWQVWMWVSEISRHLILHRNTVRCFIKSVTVYSHH